MMESCYQCDGPCYCTKTNHRKTHLIAITGGPGAGKTAVLEFVRKILCPHVALLPEAASILFRGGFWRLNSESATKAAQRAIYHVQQEMQTLCLREKKWTIGLCDRGTLDGIAYWPGTQKEYFNYLNTSLEAEFSKYMAVIHMRSPSLEKGYNKQNVTRIESAAQAAIIDEKIHHVWHKHPNYFIVDSKSQFVEKLNIASLHIQELVAEHCHNPIVEIQIKSRSKKI